MNFLDRLSHSWNVFKGLKDEVPKNTFGYGSTVPQHHTSVNRFNEMSIIKTMYNRIAVDISMINITHIKVDKKTEDHIPQDSLLNQCLTVEANIDQSAMNFWKDLVFSMLDEGVVAVVPVDTTKTMVNSNAYDIATMRVGRITQWYPKEVTVHLYDDNTGNFKDITISKSKIAIVENPFREIMDKNNAALKRLMRAMSLSDMLDETLSKNKFNLIIQLAYAVNHEFRKNQANERVEEIQRQLLDNDYGIAYLDHTEKVTQLTRPIDNGFLEKIQDLRNHWFDLNGMSEKLMKGEASDEEQITYFNRMLEPILKVIKQEFDRKFLSKTARTQGQQIFYYRNVFKAVSIGTLGDVGDTLMRNRILTANEFRGVLGFRPSNEPQADILINPNMPDDTQGQNGFYDDESIVEEESQHRIVISGLEKKGD